MKQRTKYWISHGSLGKWVVLKIGRKRWGHYRYHSIIILSRLWIHFLYCHLFAIFVTESGVYPSDGVTIRRAVRRTYSSIHWYRATPDTPIYRDLFNGGANIQDMFFRALRETPRWVKEGSKLVARLAVQRLSPLPPSFKVKSSVFWDKQKDAFLAWGFRIVVAASWESSIP